MFVCLYVCMFACISVHKYIHILVSKLSTAIFIDKILSVILSDNKLTVRKYAASIEIYYH